MRCVVRIGFVYLLVRVNYAGGGADQGDEKATNRVLVEGMGSGGSGVLWLELEHGSIPVGAGEDSQVGGYGVVGRSTLCTMLYVHGHNNASLERSDLVMS